MSRPSPRPSRIDRLPSPGPSPEELVAEVEDFPVDPRVNNRMRYAQKMAQHRAKRFKWGMARLPASDRLIIRLSLMGKSQREISEVAGLSQPTVQEHLHSAQERLRWLCQVRYSLPAAKLSRLTLPVLPREHRQVLLLWWDVGSQREVSRRLYGNDSYVSVNKVRNSLLLSRRIIKTTTWLWRVTNALDSLWENSQLMGPVLSKNPKYRPITPGDG